MSSLSKPGGGCVLGDVFNIQDEELHESTELMQLMSKHERDSEVAVRLTK